MQQEGGKEKIFNINNIPKNISCLDYWSMIWLKVVFYMLLNNE
jgi:hypothetical protein